MPTNMKLRKLDHYWKSGEFFVFSDSCIDTCQMLAVGIGICYPPIDNTLSTRLDRVRSSNRHQNGLQKK